MGSGWRSGGRRPRQFDRRTGHGGPGPDASAASDVLMALVSIMRDTGNFETPLRHARELVTLDSADARLRSLASDIEKRQPHFRHAIAVPVDELTSELR